MWSSTTSLRKSVKKLNKKLGEKHAQGTSGTIFKKDEQECCILSISGSQSESESNIAVLDKSSCRVIFYTLGASLTPVKVQNCEPQNRERDVLGVKFSPISKDIYYIASEESIIMYDQRTASQIVETFKTDIDGRAIKEISCFDINCNERLIAAGTETSIGDAFVLFWDVRYRKKKTPHAESSAFLGGYWESHKDDVTWLAFHPSQQNILASGSTDGLMNVFDLEQSSEDEALTYSLNTESSVDRLGWLTDSSLWCTTHIETLQLWDCEGVNPYAKFERSNLAMSKIEDPDDCYIVKVHTSSALEQPFLLAGYNTTERQYLRCLSFKNNCLEMHHNLMKNKQVVRDSWLHEKSGILVTAGEGDFLDVWRLNSTQDKFVTKINVEKNSHCRAKPY